VATVLVAVAITETLSEPFATSMVVLASSRGLHGGTVRDFLGIDVKTYRKYLRTFENGGHAALFARQTKSTRKFDNEAVKQAVFSLLHEPPSNYGINRTKWIMPDLSRVLRETGQPACPDVIRAITSIAGYRWRKARKVLTSTDPKYREKVHHIQSILAELQENEAFFSIDEYGPFFIRAQGGRALAGPGEMPTVPQYQKSKGCLIMTTALELHTNPAATIQSLNLMIPTPLTSETIADDLIIAKSIIAIGMTSLERADYRAAALVDDHNFLRHLSASGGGSQHAILSARTTALIEPPLGFVTALKAITGVANNLSRTSGSQMTLSKTACQCNLRRGRRRVALGVWFRNNMGVNANGRSRRNHVSIRTKSRTGPSEAARHAARIPD
jgi:hypothetical protein